MTRRWLAPLNPVYRVALMAKNLAYDRGLITPKRLPWPVVSVGNLSVGGAGKTPLTIGLAHLLKSSGFDVDVLSRGYGRSSTATGQVDPAGEARRFGDEPLLIARRAGVPVFVGASRYEAGLFAEQQIARPVVHLLDDGFQHRQLARSVDVVVLHRSDFSERLLPAGRLREPLQALSRADFLVCRQEDADLEAKLRSLGLQVPIWWMQRTLRPPEDLTASIKRAVAFCGIARPEEFFSALLAGGINVELTVAFADHHRYSRGDGDRLAQIAAKVEADAFVTTEKDAVRLDASLLQLLESRAPVRVAPLDVSLRDEPLIVAQLRAKLPTT